MTIDEAIKWLNVEASYIEEDVGNGKEILEAYDMAIKALEQQPKTGRWIEVTDKTDRLGNGIWYHKCSICENEDSGWGEYKYCPNCGAKMEVET